MLVSRLFLAFIHEKVYTTLLLYIFKGSNIMSDNRERLGSRLGFIMLSAGCAIGCGNVWKFPWMTGQNGGGGFVLIYLICLTLLGLPAI